jgi:hypothetical protein
MTRSGMETIFRAVLYSGFFSKRELCSSVETSSVYGVVSWDFGELGGKEGYFGGDGEWENGRQTFVSLLELGLRWEVGHDCEGVWLSVQLMVRVVV